MEDWLLHLLTWIVIGAAGAGLLYTSKALLTARQDRAIIVRRNRNGARLIAVDGRILQERLATAIMASFLWCGLASFLAPPGWLRGTIIPALILGIILTALKSYYRTKTRRQVLEYLDSSIPEQVPVEAVDALTDIVGNLDERAIEGGN